MIRQMSVCDTLQVVVIRILCHSPVDKCPSEVVHCVLLVLYSLGYDFGIEVIVQEVVQMRLQHRNFTFE